MKKLKSNKELEELIANEKYLVVDYSTTWCGPCKQLEPLLVQYEKEHPAVVVVKVDCDAHDELATEHRIQSVPTVEVFVKGVRVERFTGFLGYPNLCKKLDKMFDKNVKSNYLALSYEIVGDCCDLE